MSFKVDDAVQKDFAAVVKTARKERYMSQDEISEYVGISRTYYSELESGHRRCSLLNALKICAVLDIDLNQFVNRYKNVFYQ